MKRVLFFLILGLVLPITAWSQIITEFSINFGGNPPPHNPTVPYSGAILTENPSDNLFSIVVYLDDTTPNSGSILQKESDNSFATISSLDLVYAAYGSPYSGTAYSAEKAWQLTAPEIQNLLAGQWYAEITYGATTYLGQLTPVPEPASVLLFACGAVMIGANRRMFRG